MSTRCAHKYRRCYKGERTTFTEHFVRAVNKHPRFPAPIEDHRLKEQTNFLAGETHVPLLNLICYLRSCGRKFRKDCCRDFLGTVEVFDINVYKKQEQFLVGKTIEI